MNSTETLEEIDEEISTIEWSVGTAMEGCIDTFSVSDANRTIKALGGSLTISGGDCMFATLHYITLLSIRHLAKD